MPKTGRNIYKRKDGRWEGRYRKGFKENGKIAYGYVYGKTFTEVRNKLKTKTIFSLQQNRNYTHNIFAEIAEKWLFNVSLKVKQSTHANYSAMLKNHILPLIGGYRIQMLTTEIIDQFAKDMLHNGRKDGNGGLSPKTVRDMLSLIKNVLDYAKIENIISTSLKITYPKREQKPIRVLSKEEQFALEKILITQPDIFKIAVLLCLYTGLRIGEICAMQWEDISLEQGIVSVKRTLQRVKNTNRDINSKTRILIDTPKSQSSMRDIPLPDFLIIFLSQFHPEHNQFFLSGDGFDYIEPRTLQNHFKKYVMLAGIAPANYHSIRHTFATRCVEAGVDIKSLSEILGHADVNITLNRYVHSSLEQKRENINKLENFKSF